MRRLKSSLDGITIAVMGVFFIFAGLPLRLLPAIAVSSFGVIYLCIGINRMVYERREADGQRQRGFEVKLIGSSAVNADTKEERE